MNQPTPAIVAQSAVRRLPRIALLLLCAAYLLPGLVGRGPWKSADVTSFGYMAELARTTEGLARWLDPLLLGLRPETPALLPYWIGAAAIKLAPSWVHPDLAVRFVFALMLWLVFTTTWYAVYFLARTPRAQPVAFAFGGEALPKDYARAMADGGLLALLACLGLAQLGHETTPALAQLFFTTHVFFGIAALPYRPLGATVALLGGTFGLTLSGAPAVGLALGLGGLLIAWQDTRRRAALGDEDDEAPGYSYKALGLIAAATAAAALLAVAVKLWHWQISLPGTHPGRSLGADIGSQLRLLLWFTWPAWPLALWTLWRWRRQLSARHVALPLWFVAVPLAATWSTNFSERSLLLGLPAFATLAAFALPTFRRSVAALIDWFTLLFFTGSALIIWIYWIAMQSGWPPKMASSVARLTLGHVPPISWLGVVFAVAATVAWCWLVRWRSGRHRAALWKTLVLPAGGAALCWLLGMTLWLPSLDHVLSYGPQVASIAQKVGTRPGCVAELGVPRPQIAALRHHGDFDLQVFDNDSSCHWLLISADAIPTLRNVVSFDRWHLIGSFRRQTSASDDLLLYERLAP